jgi:hypothetical protein
MTAPAKSRLGRETARSSTARTARVALGGAVLLLTGVAARAALRGTLLAGRSAVRLLALWRVAAGLLAVALLRRRAVLALRGRSAVLATLRWGTAVALLGRRSVAARSRVSLLVLGIVGAVDGAKEELDDPQIGGEVNRGVGAHHLLLLVLEVC